MWKAWIHILIYNLLVFFSAVLISEFAFLLMLCHEQKRKQSIPNGHFAYKVHMNQIVMRFLLYRTGRFLLICPEDGKSLPYLKAFGGFHLLQIHLSKDLSTEIN